MVEPNASLPVDLRELERIAEANLGWEYARAEVAIVMRALPSLLATAREVEALRTDRSEFARLLAPYRSPTNPDESDLEVLGVTLADYADADAYAAGLRDHVETLTKENERLQGVMERLKARRAMNDRLQGIVGGLTSEQLDILEQDWNTTLPADVEGAAAEMYRIVGSFPKLLEMAREQVTYQEIHMEIMEEACTDKATDEVHCTCVPSLRQHVRALLAQVASLSTERETLQAERDALSREHGIDRKAIEEFKDLDYIQSCQIKELEAEREALADENMRLRHDVDCPVHTDEELVEYYEAECGLKFYTSRERDRHEQKHKVARGSSPATEKGT